MSDLSCPADILRSPEVKNYFLGVLESELSAQQKYEKIIDFFQTKEDLEIKILEDYSDRLLGSEKDAIEIARVVSSAAQEINIWNPKAVLENTKHSIERALHRLKYSQTEEGCWGYHWQENSVWGTAGSLLCLSAAQAEQFDFDFDFNGMALR